MFNGFCSANLSTAEIISCSFQGAPIRALPTITPAAQDLSNASIASLALLISPLTKTGISTASTVSLTALQSAFPS